ncbi:DUF423-domain-containing protein [Ceratobasidium sp. AG-I]|nr:DUF423-domain-containing protein [Ceratobasidium sp. AG-I]
MAFVTPSLLWRTGAITTALAIALGAFGAHGLGKRKGITPVQIQAWTTAAHYATFNGIGLLAISAHPRFSVHRFAGPAIAIGTALFSGSVFTLVLNRDRFKFLGPVTPMGGMLMIAGYASLAF